MKSGRWMSKRVSLPTFVRKGCMWYNQKGFSILRMLKGMLAPAILLRTRVKHLGVGMCALMKWSKILGLYKVHEKLVFPKKWVGDVEVLCGKVKYPVDFLVLDSPQDKFCPIIFGRPFLNTVTIMSQYLCLFSLILQGLHEEEECRQLEFWAGKGENIRDLLCTAPKVLKLHGGSFWN